MVVKDRETGISVIGKVPWGSHICVFHKTVQDLLTTQAPFFQAGLQNNEFCVCISRYTIGKKENLAKTVSEMPDLRQNLEIGQLEFIPYSGIYLVNGVFNPQKALDILTEILKRAQEKGYDGVRISSTSPWHGNGGRRLLSRYEAELDAFIKQNNVISLCAHPIDKYGTCDFIDVIRSHQYTFIVQDGENVSLEQRTLGQFNRNGNLALDRNIRQIQARETLKQSEARYLSIIQKLKQRGQESELYLDNAAVILLATDPSGKVTHINNKGCEIVGYSKNEIMGKTWFINFVPPRTREEYHSINLKLLSGEKKEVAYHEYPILTKNGEEKLIAWYTTMIRDDRGNINGVYRTGIDITDRKRTEEALRESKDLTALKPAEANQVVLSRVKSEKHPTELQERFIREGFKGFEDQAIIELLLSMVLSAQKAKQLAKACIERFQNLGDFLAAPPEELKRIGITPVCMLYIKLLHELPAKVLKQRIVSRTVYISSKEVFDYLYYSMRDLKKEVFKVISLNHVNQIIDIFNLFKGTSDRIAINATEIIEGAIAHDTKFLVFVHNHPSGDPYPSEADKQLTRDLVFVSNILQIRTLDHIIIGKNRYFSFADEGLIKEYELDFLNLKLTGTTEAKRRLTEARLAIAKQPAHLLLYLLGLLPILGAVFSSQSLQ